MDIRKIYIDSYFKKSGTDSNFTIELDESINTPENTVAYIDEMVIPNVMKIIDERNNKIYISISVNESTFYDVLTIPIGNYNGIEYKNILNQIFLDYTNNFGINNPTILFKIDFSYDLLKNILTIKLSDTRITDDFYPLIFKFYSNNDIINGSFNNQAINLYDIRSFNETISLDTTLIMLKNIEYTRILNLRTTKNLYLHCSDLSSNDSTSNFNMNTIVKKIILYSSSNELNITMSQSAIDYLFVGKRSLKRLSFRLTDKMNNIVNLYGNSVSFSIIFMNK